MTEGFWNLPSAQLLYLKFWPEAVLFFLPFLLFPPGRWELRIKGRGIKDISHMQLFQFSSFFCCNQFLNETDKMSKMLSISWPALLCDTFLCKSYFLLASLRSHGIIMLCTAIPVSFETALGCPSQHGWTADLSSFRTRCLWNGAWERQ